MSTSVKNADVIPTVTPKVTHVGAYHRPLDGNLRKMTTSAEEFSQLQLTPKLSSI